MDVVRPMSWVRLEFDMVFKLTLEHVSMGLSVICVNAEYE